MKSYVATTKAGAIDEVVRVVRADGGFVVAQVATNDEGGMSGSAGAHATGQATTAGAGGSASPPPGKSNKSLSTDDLIQREVRSVDLLLTQRVLPAAVTGTLARPTSSPALCGDVHVQSNLWTNVS